MGTGDVMHLHRRKENGWLFLCLRMMVSWYMTTSSLILFLKHAPLKISLARRLAVLHIGLKPVSVGLLTKVDEGIYKNSQLIVTIALQLILR